MKMKTVSPVSATKLNIAQLFDLSRITNEALSSDGDPKLLKSLFHIWNVLGGEILGIIPKEQSGYSQNGDVLDTVIETIIGWRKEARINKDYKMSDAIRNDLESAGVLLEDAKDGTTSWSVK